MNKAPLTPSCAASTVPPIARALDQLRSAVDDAEHMIDRLADSISPVMSHEVPAAPVAAGLCSPRDGSSVAMALEDCNDRVRKVVTTISRMIDRVEL